MVRAPHYHRPAAPSPAQIRAQASRAIRAHQRRQQPSLDELTRLVTVRLADLAPRPLRPPMARETPLSADEVRHGLYHGLISAEPA